MLGVQKSILGKIIYLSYVTMSRDESATEKKAVALKSNRGDLTSTKNKCFSKKIKGNKIQSSRTIKR
jgi:hypothetical protein